jgi:hypothetical protein
MMRKIWMGLGFAAGYVLGARAGRERYQQLKQQATRLAERPQVKQVTQRVAEAATGKLQQNPRANAGLQKARGFATGMGRRRRGGPAEQTAGAPLVPQPPMPPAVAPEQPITDPTRDVAAPPDRP